MDHVEQRQPGGADGIGGAVVGCGTCTDCQCGRLRAALQTIGFSRHTGSERLGPKAQAARWGLGLDTWPPEYGPQPS